MIKLHACKICTPKLSLISFFIISLTFIVNIEKFVCISLKLQTLLWNPLSGQLIMSWEKKETQTIANENEIVCVVLHFYIEFGRCDGGQDQLRCCNFTRWRCCCCCCHFLHYLSNYEFFVQNGNRWAVAVKAERTQSNRTHHGKSLFIMVPHNALLFLHYTTPYTSVFGKLSIIYISEGM